MQATAQQIPTHGIVVAIDGPAASGKSTVARTVADHLGFHYVNTGAMYRAVTWLALREGVDTTCEEAILSVLDRYPLQVRLHEGQTDLLLGGSDDPSPHLSEKPVAANVSVVARHPAIRQRLVAIQRAVAHGQNVVMEGRDIGTVVFPQAAHKFYIDARPEVREARRRAQGHQDAITTRDSMDRSRTASPLQVAPDALRVDSSDLTVREVALLILAAIKTKENREITPDPCTTSP